VCVRSTNVGSEAASASRSESMTGRLVAGLLSCRRFLHNTARGPNR
jgi:hypothetical protein